MCCVDIFLTGYDVILTTMVYASKKSVQLQNNILKQLYFNKELSSAGLSQLLSKSTPSITKSLKELVDKGLVIERGYAASKGGRRPLVYALPEMANFIVAVAMDQLVTRLSIVDLQNNRVVPVETIKLTLLDNKEALSLLITAIKAFIKKSGVDFPKILGVGIGMPGFINNREGVNYSYLESEGMSLQQNLERSIGLPVYIDNDSSLVALAELKFGLAKEKESVMIINIGWGIGLGMTLNGHIFRGYNGYAGEFSHIPIVENGQLCVCGKQGCLETEASLMVVTRKAIEEIKNGKITSLRNVGQTHPASMGDALMEAANQGDQFAIELLSEMGYKIGKAIAILIHIMDPELIVLSGRGAKTGRMLIAPIKNALNKYCIPRLSANTGVLISELGYDAELIGAAALVMEHLGEPI